jgi:hypothetical protein
VKRHAGSRAENAFRIVCMLIPTLKFTSAHGPFRKVLIK